MIHKTAIIDPKAKIGSNVEIGPYCVIGQNVEIGENTIIHSHVNISVSAKIGKGNVIYPFVCFVKHIGINVCSYFFANLAHFRVLLLI